MALWITEALSLPASALLAAAACVVAGVTPANEVFGLCFTGLCFISSFILPEAIWIHRLDTRWDKEGNITRQVRHETGQLVETIK